MTKFRYHRGLLVDSMATVVDVTTFADLVTLVADNCQDFGWGEADQESVTVKPYGFDHRIAWDTHIVCLNGKAVGFTDGPL